jgi:hypothetical protein
MSRDEPRDPEGFLKVEGSGGAFYLAWGRDSSLWSCTVVKLDDPLRESQRGGQRRRNGFGGYTAK